MLTLLNGKTLLVLMPRARCHIKLPAQLEWLGSCLPTVTEFFKASRGLPSLLVLTTRNFPACLRAHHGVTARSIVRRSLYSHSHWALPMV